uniref:Uncharacterized protein n=1 Tax=Anopheles atroparvus TaxID=41427 RepID=A0A182IL49_ANOAO
MSLPPIVIVSIFQSRRKLTRGSVRMRVTIWAAMCGSSFETAPISALLNCESQWKLYESRMFGNVVAFRQPHWPPMHHERPRFSVYSCRKLVADAPLAKVAARLVAGAAGHQHRDVPVEVKDDAPLRVIEDGRLEGTDGGVHLPSVEFVFVTQQQQQHQQHTEGRLPELHYQ